MLYYCSDLLFLYVVWSFVFTARSFLCGGTPQGWCCGFVLHYLDYTLQKVICQPLFGKNQRGGSRMNERLFRRLAQIVNGQKKLAEILGVSPNTISAWKTRGNPPPSKYLPQIAEFIGVSMEWLVSGAEPAAASVTVAGGVSNGAIVQGLHGRVSVVNGTEHPLSVEAAEILRLYESMDVRTRIKLLQSAYDLIEKDEGR
jgi:transcriptional regulator with XRE-family HTH domain